MKQIFVILTMMLLIATAVSAYNLPVVGVSEESGEFEGDSHRSTFLDTLLLQSIAVESTGEEWEAVKFNVEFPAPTSWLGICPAPTLYETLCSRRFNSGAPEAKQGQASGTTCDLGGFYNRQTPITWNLLTPYKHTYTRQGGVPAGEHFYEAYVKCAPTSIYTVGYEKISFDISSELEPIPECREDVKRYCDANFIYTTWCGDEIGKEQYDSTYFQCDLTVPTTGETGNPTSLRTCAEDPVTRCSRSEGTYWVEHCGEQKKQSIPDGLVCTFDGVLKVSSDFDFPELPKLPCLINCDDDDTDGGAAPDAAKRPSLTKEEIKDASPLDLWKSRCASKDVCATRGDDYQSPTCPKLSSFREPSLIEEIVSPLSTIFVFDDLVRVCHVEPVKDSLLDVFAPFGEFIHGLGFLNDIDAGRLGFMLIVLLFLIAAILMR